jgi:hypothetical protein
MNDTFSLVANLWFPALRASLSPIQTWSVSSNSDTWSIFSLRSNGDQLLSLVTTAFGAVLQGRFYPAGLCIVSTVQVPLEVVKRLAKGWQGLGFGTGISSAVRTEVSSSETWWEISLKVWPEQAATWPEPWGSRGGGCWIRESHGRSTSGHTSGHTSGYCRYGCRRHHFERNHLHDREVKQA